MVFLYISCDQARSNVNLKKKTNEGCLVHLDVQYFCLQLNMKQLEEQQMEKLQLIISPQIKLCLLQVYFL